MADVRSRGVHETRALQYIDAVLSGELTACKWIKAACQRQLDDLARAESDPTWPYEWRPQEGERRCLGLELLPHIKGRWAGQRLRLQPWQSFVVMVVYGWVYRESGARRFREVYEEVARKNAKSTKIGGLALLALTADGELGAEVYSAATKLDQAKIVFDTARTMARMAPDFRAHFGVTVLKHAIVVEDTGSKFRPLAAEANSLDGLNVSFAAVDELHAHRTREVYDVLRTATGAREQPLNWNITTAGTDRAGICYERREYGCGVLNATLRKHGGLGYPVKGAAYEDDSLAVFIWTIDDTDDPLDERVWIKANPNLGVSVDVVDLRRKAAEARRLPAALSTFKTKHLDVWVNADAAWMDMLKWDACADPNLREEDFRGEPCWVGLDAAFRTDVFAEAHVYEREGHYYAFGRYYMPQAKVEADGNDHFAAWRDAGRIEVTPGEVVDVERVRESMLGLDGRGGHLAFAEVRNCGYDPAQMQQFAAELIEDGAPMIEVRPTVLNFSEPMKLLEELVVSGRFHHDGDPIMGWMVSNVVCHRDKKDNIYPNKNKPEQKIDIVIAILMALKLAPAPTVRSVYDQRAATGEELVTFA